MACILEELFLDDRRENLLAQIQAFLRKKLSRKMERQILSNYFYIDNSEEKDLKIWKNDILDTAVSELAGQLLEHCDEVKFLLIKLRQAVQDGEISPADVGTEILNKGFSYLQGSLKDRERKQQPAKSLYKRLRECLTKSGAIARSPDGKAYGPSDLPPESPVAPSTLMDFADFPEPETVPTDKVITQKYLVPQALRFWDCCIRQRLNGIPHFLPFIVLQYWLCRTYDLLPLSQSEGLYSEGADGTSELRALPELTSTSTADICLEEAEMLERAQSFALSLPDRLTALCTLYYADDNARQEDVARTLGFRSAAGLDRHKKDFERRLRAFMTEYADLLDQSPAGEQLAQNFLDTVYNECKKRYLASNREAGGLHHD